jgi:large subunit ribosomal protein L21
LEADMHAVIRTGGKQYKIAPGESIDVERVGADVGEKVEIDQVLLISDESGVVVGKPLVPGAKVVARVIEEGRGTKVTVFKFTGGNRYQRKRGHRQEYCRLLVEEIVQGEVEEEPAVAAEAKEAAPVEVKEKPPVAELSIAELDLPSRVVGALEGAGLDTAQKVAKSTDEELLAIRGFGPKSLEQVRDTLKEKGIIVEQ